MMQATTKQAADHWAYVAPLLEPPTSETDYDAKAAALDELLDIIGEDEAHPLASLASHLGELIEAYDEATRPMPIVGGASVLRYLMAEHGLRQGDLPEIGTQSVVSEILSGRRGLNWRQVCALAERFDVSTDAFRG